MIVSDIDRFATNWGVDPNSINLKAIWTNKIGARNIENVGKSFDNDSDFGDGLTGLGDDTTTLLTLPGQVTDPNATPLTTVDNTLSNFIAANPITPVLGSSLDLGTLGLIAVGGFVVVEVLAGKPKVTTYSRKRR